MGSLRAIFAISVVFAHSYGFVFVGGQNAVQLFYIISGFLISFILIEIKNYSGLRSFYINRYLRLYPIYIFIAILTFIVTLTLYRGNLGADAFLNIYQSSPVAASVLLVFSNIFLFGQDLVIFSGVENGSLVLTSNFRTSEIPLWRGLLIPQAWTLEIELLFYLVAPFILPKRKIIITLLIASVILRGYLVYLGIGATDPWTYRFFPTELAFFLLGALSHQILYPKYKEIPSEILGTVSKVATYFLIFISLFYYLIPLNNYIRMAVLFPLFIMLLPFTFIYQRENRVDGWIGNLSYPIYINHVLVITVVTTISHKFLVNDRLVISILSVIFSVLFAVLLEKYIGAPMEKVRANFRKENS